MRFIAFEAVTPKAFVADAAAITRDVLHALSSTEACRRVLLDTWTRLGAIRTEVVESTLSAFKTIPLVPTIAGAVATGAHVASTMGVAGVAATAPTCDSTARTCEPILTLCAKISSPVA